MYDAVTEIRDDIVEQAAEYRFKKSPAYIMKPLGIAAAVCVAVGGAVTAAVLLGRNAPGTGNTANGIPNTTADLVSRDHLTQETAGFITDESYGETVAATAIPETYSMELDPDTGYQVGWEDMPAFVKFREFTHGEDTYRGFRIMGGAGIIPESSMGEKLYDVTMSTREEFSQQDFYINAEVYAIKDVLPEAAVAVRFEGTDEYCSFRNCDYRAKDLGALMDALDLADSGTFDMIQLSPQFSGNTLLQYDPMPVDAEKTEIIKKFLDEGRDLPGRTEDSFPEYRTLFTISVSSESAGIQYKAIWFTDTGMMITNIMEHADMFEVGSARIQQLAEALGVWEQEPFVVTYEFAPQTSRVDEYGEETRQEDVVVMYTQSTTSAAYIPQTIPE